MQLACLFLLEHGAFEAAAPDEPPPTIAARVPKLQNSDVCSACTSPFEHLNDLSCSSRLPRPAPREPPNQVGAMTQPQVLRCLGKQ